MPNVTTGVSMEYLWTGPKNELDEDHPFAFCESFLDSTVFEICGKWQLLILTTSFGWSFVDAVETCIQSSNKKISDICTNRVGPTAVHLAKGDLNAILEYCSSVRGISTIAQRNRLLGAALENEYQKYYDWENTVNTLLAASEKAALDSK